MANLLIAVCVLAACVVLSSARGGYGFNSGGFGFNSHNIHNSYNRPRPIPQPVAPAAAPTAAPTTAPTAAPAQTCIESGGICTQACTVGAFTVQATLTCPGTNVCCQTA